MAFVFRFLKSMLLVVLLAAGTSALAQTPGNGEPLTDGVAGEWQQILDRVSERLQNKRLSEEDRLLLRRQIEYVFQEAQEEAKKVREEAVSAAQLLAALGPGPKEGEPPEAGEIARKRQALTRHLTRIKGHIKQAEFSAVRAERLIQRMVKTQQSRLWDRLLKMEPSPLLPAVWAQAIPEFREIILAFLTAPIEWAQSDELAGRWKQSVWVVLGALVISILIGWPLRVWLLRRYGHVPSLEEPSYARRLLAAVVEGVARGLLPSLAVVAVLVVMLSLGLLDGLFGAIVTVAITNLVIFVVVAALANAAFTPHLPNWRVTNFSDESSKRASHRIIALTAVFAITNTLSAPSEMVNVSNSLDAAFTILFGTVTAVFLLALLRRDVWQTVAAGPAEGAAAQVMAETAEPAKKHGLWDKVRILAMLVVIAAPIAGAVGYVHLTKYLLLNIILSGLLLGLLALLRGVFHDVVVLLLNRQQNMPGTFNRMLEITDQSRNFLHFVLVSLIDLLILIGGVLAALSIWGMQPHEITAWIGLALQGVSIGSYTFSLTDLLLAVLIFVIVIIVTRAVQWVLEERVLPQTRLDIGVRHSLKRSIGYVGLVIALFMAVSTLGIDLSNVAIVAGALSVGIGFGLQSLVNNFVSGLILLIERPIKVGDWIVVGAQEGYVKRINVRATEITTFQQASVIIPNAEFLTNSVTNWTHKNVQGRVEVQVGVAYGTDAEKVSDILIDCAKEHPEVLTYPEPTALFMDFADSSLLFELRAFVKEIDRRRRIASDLRFAINAAFIREGVEIPFPQRVVHMPGKD